MKRIVPLLLLLSACGQSAFDLAKETNSIDGWEAFLRENPEHKHAYLGKAILEELYWEEAVAKNELESWDAFLSRYPESPNAKNANQAAEKCAYRLAEEANTRESWEGFLARYKYNQSFLKEEAEKRLELVAYQDTLVFGEVKVEPVNLAQDPEGEPNGYAVSVDITNNTGKSIKYLNLKLDFMSDSDGPIKEDRWPLVAEKNPDRTNRSDEERRAIRMGETRSFYNMYEPPGSEFNEAEADERWNRQVVVQPISVIFEE